MIDGLLANGVPCAVGIPLIDGVLGTIGALFAGMSGTAVSTMTTLYSSSCALPSLAGGPEPRCVFVLSILVPTFVIIRVAALFKGRPQYPQNRA